MALVFKPNANHRSKVLIPAPVFLLIAILTGSGLNTLWPMQLNAIVIQNIAGWTYNIAATLLLVWCFVLFLRRKTTIIPGNPVDTLVTDGPYRYSRNPMYLSIALYHLGIAMATGIIWHVFTFVPTLIAIRLWVITPEETYLREHFGEAYNRYCLQVPRWF